MHAAKDDLPIGMEIQILPPPAPAMADVSACPPGCHGTCGSPAMLTPA